MLKVKTQSARNLQSRFAGWCESVNSQPQFKLCPGGGIGRRTGFKIQRLQERAGSIPAPGTENLFRNGEVFLCPYANPSLKLSLPP